MNIAICDENTKDGELIKKLVSGYFSEIGIDFTCFIFDTSIDLLVSNESFDIVIINPGFTEISNSSIISFIKRKNSAAALIFIADDYTYLNIAFDSGARRYLIKPVGKTLLPALDSAINYLVSETDEYYIIEENSTVKRISKSSIIYLEIFGRKTKIATKNDYYISKTKMQEIQKSLNPIQFASPHKSFYVNMEQITEYRRFGGQYYICMSDNKFIPITRTRKAEFEKAYFNFLKSKNQFKQE